MGPKLKRWEMLRNRNGRLISEKSLQKECLLVEKCCRKWINSTFVECASYNNEMVHFAGVLKIFSQLKLLFTATAEELRSFQKNTSVYMDSLFREMFAQEHMFFYRIYDITVSSKQLHWKLLKKDTFAVCLPVRCFVGSIFSLHFIFFFLMFNSKKRHFFLLFVCLFFFLWS